MSDVRGLSASRKILEARLDFRAMVYFVSLLPLVITGYVDAVPALSRMKIVLTLVSYALIALIFATARTRKIDLSTGLAFVLIVDLAISTLLFQGLTGRFIQYIAPLFMATALWVCTGERECDSMLAALNAISVALIYGNAILLLVFPEGMYSNASSDVTSFLGHNNAVARTTVPLLLFGILYCYRKYNRFSAGIVLRTLVVFATALFTGSGSGVVGILPVLLLVVLWRVLAKRTINIYLLFGISMGLWAIIVFAQVGFVEYVIVNVFQKDPTLTGRTLIWERAVEYIANSLLLGYGYSDNFTLTNGFILSSTGQSAHNYYLDLLLRGGLVQLVLHIAIVFVAMRKIEKDIRRTSNVLANILSVGMFSYFIMWLIEPFVGSGMVLMYSFIFYICRCPRVYKSSLAVREKVIA